MALNELHGKQARLTDLISIQPGAIVSKTLIERPTGTVTLFAFDKGQKLSEHTAPFDALVTALQGSVDITLDGGRRYRHAGRRHPCRRCAGTMHLAADNDPVLTSGGRRMTVPRHDGSAWQFNRKVLAD